MEHQHSDAEGHAFYHSATLETPLDWLDLVLGSLEAPRDMVNSYALCNKPKTTGSTDRWEVSFWNTAALCPAYSNIQVPNIQMLLQSCTLERTACVNFAGLEGESGLCYLQARDPGQAPYPS